MLRRLLPFVALAALGVGVSGCYSKATAYGGKFTFAYESMVEHDNFVKPIAVGAKLEVLAFANGTHDRLTVKSARSLKPEVVAIESTRAKSVILAGKSVGVAEIEVTSTDANGNELVDKMFFHVAKPTKHALEHACGDKPNVAYVAGDQVVVHHSLATDDKRNVVGFDYAPLKVEPRGALDLVAQPQAGGYYLFKTKSPKDRITIRSEIDSKELTVRLIDRKDLNEATLYYADRMLTGRRAYIVAEVSAGETPLCSQNALTTAKSLTPDICKVTARLEDDPDDEDLNREQLAMVTALKFGVCKFEVTLPELARGKGITMKGEVKIGREEYPGDQKRVDEEVREKLLEWSRPANTLSEAKDGVALAFLGLWWLKRRARRRTIRAEALRRSA